MNEAVGKAASDFESYLLGESLGYWAYDTLQQALFNLFCWSYSVTDAKMNIQ